MKGLARFAIVFALAFAPAARADMKALEEAAKKEGELTWYVAHYTSEGAEDLGRGFTEMTGIKVNVVRTTAQVAYQRLLQDIKNNQTICDVFSSTDVGHYVRLSAEGRFEKYTPETESQDRPGLQELRSRRLLSHDICRTGPADLQFGEGEGRRRAQEVAGPARHQVEGQGIGRPSRLLGLCRHVGSDHEQPLRLVVFRETREEQAADRPLHQRHRDGAHVGRAPGRRRRRRLDVVQRLERRSVGASTRRTAPC